MPLGSTRLRLTNKPKAGGASQLHSADSPAPCGTRTASHFPSYRKGTEVEEKKEKTKEKERKNDESGWMKKDDKEITRNSIVQEIRNKGRKMAQRSNLHNLPALVFHLCREKNDSSSSSSSSTTTTLSTNLRWKQKASVSQKTFFFSIFPKAIIHRARSVPLYE